MGNLSKNFSDTEFFKPDTYQEIKMGGHEPKWHISAQLVYKLQAIRDHFDTRIYINSGYRTEAENIAAGSIKKFSMHREGKAADIVVEDVDASEVQKFCKKEFVGGLGCYPTFTHIDVRFSKELVIWEGT